MQSQSIFLFLAIGAVAVTAEEEISLYKYNEPRSIVKRHVSKRATRPVAPEFPLHGQIENFVKKTNTEIDIIEKTIGTRAKKEKEILDKEIRDIKNYIKSKQEEEITGAKRNGPRYDAKQIVVCVQNEQKQFEADVNDAHNQAIKCVNKVTQSAKNNNQNAKKTFFDDSLYSPTFKEGLWVKWHSCSHGLGRTSCIRGVVTEAMDRVKLTGDASTKAIRMSKKADKTHADDVLSCHTTIETNVKERMKEHSENVKYCSINPTPWKYKWSL